MADSFGKRVPEKQPEKYAELVEMARAGEPKRQTSFRSERRAATWAAVFTPAGIVAVLLFLTAGVAILLGRNLIGGLIAFVASIVLSAAVKNNNAK